VKAARPLCVFAVAPIYVLDLVGYGTSEINRSAKLRSATAR
jgi:hypothetical protein